MATPCYIMVNVAINTIEHLATFSCKSAAHYSRRMDEGHRWRRTINEQTSVFRQTWRNGSSWTSLVISIIIIIISCCNNGDRSTLQLSLNYKDNSINRQPMNMSHSTNDTRSLTRQSVRLSRRISADTSAKTATCMSLLRFVRLSIRLSAVLSKQHASESFVRAQRTLRAAS